jgi:hypothetical protein
VSKNVSHRLHSLTGGAGNHDVNAFHLQNSCRLKLNQGYPFVESDAVQRKSPYLLDGIGAISFLHRFLLFGSLIAS